MDTHSQLALPVGVTLDRYIMRQQSAFPFATGELSQLLRDIALAGKIINREINRAGLIDVIGGMDNENIQGEAQQKLDVIANIRFIRAIVNGGEACAIISEEEENIIYTGNDNGKYVVAIDPLDGSSNIDVNVSVGTIFSIYRRVTPIGTKAGLEDFLQGGHKQVAAGYILYGSSTMLIYTTGSGVSGFTYEASLGEFFLSHPQMLTPQQGAIYSCNEANFNDFPPAIKTYLEGMRSKGCSSRYIGSLVADLHRNMLKGGIYLYPPLYKSAEGKLRLLYECYPLAFIIEQAGGKACNGKQSIMDLMPLSIHQRSPFYIGSAQMVSNFMDTYNLEQAEIKKA